MSDKEKITEDKAMTKYDLKKQKKEEALAKAKKQKRNEKIIWAVVIVAIVAIIASFPIRSYMNIHSTYVRIAGEDISKLEFDYNYNVVKNNYLTQYGDYLSYFGLDLTSDFSAEMYSDTLTWKDFFEQMTVESIGEGKMLKADAEKNGFTYDVDADYEEYVAGITAAAEESGLTEKEYIRQSYGNYATLDRVEEFIKDSLYVNAYYIHLSNELYPTDEAVQEYYEENAYAFESVDYYATTINADLSTEAAEGTEETVEPTEEEIAKAMADAKALAEAAVETITTEGSFNESIVYSNASTLIRDWLFDDSRKEGDTTVIEDSAGNRYYVLSFVSRYLDETATADARVIITEEDNGQAILDAWKSGEATAESFGVLADEYNTQGYYPAGGICTALTKSDVPDDVAEWLFAEERAEGDTTTMASSNGLTYTIYYVAPNDMEWRVNAKTELLAVELQEYIQGVCAEFDVDDFKNKLNYLDVLEAQPAETAE